MTTPVNRYKQLLALIPTGNFYASSGQVLPHRSSPYQLRLLADEPNRLYYVMLNGVQVTSVISDVNSYAIFNIQLHKGDNNIQLINSLNATVVNATLTTRDYATWLAALASIVESIDSSIEKVLTDSRLATVASDMIDDVFGRTVESSNVFAYDLESYRELLQELRVAYRHYGSTDGGINRVVRAFFGVSPIMYDRDISEAWRLGADLLYPSNRASAITSSFPSGGLLSTISTGGANVRVVEADTRQVGNLTFNKQISPNPAYAQISYRPPTNGVNDAAYGAPVVITANGEYELTGYVQQALMSYPQGYTKPAPHDKLSVEIDGRGELVVDVPSTTAVGIASDINTAFNASPLYGPAYSAVAWRAGPPIVGTTQHVYIRSPNAGGKVKIRKAPSTATSSSLSQILYDMPATRFEISTDLSVVVAGARTISYTANSLVAAMPDPDPDNGLWAILDSRSAFATAGGTYIGTLPGTDNVERVKILSINRTLSQVTVESITLPHSAGSTLYLEGDEILESITYESNAKISVGNIGALVVGAATDNVSSFGTNLPAEWLLQTYPGGAAASLPLANGAAYDTRLINDGSFAFYMPPGHMLTIPIDQANDYIGFGLSVHVHAFNRFITGTANVSFQVSYNNGASWTSLVSSTSGVINLSKSIAKTHTVTLNVEPDTTRLLIRVITDPANTDHVTIQRISVVLNGIATGLYLGSGSTPNNDMRLKSGKILYWWASNPTADEMAAAGLGSSTQDSPGHVDKVAPDFAWLDKYNASDANNIVGITSDTGLASCTNTNLDLIIRSPAKFSHLSPVLESEHSENVSWTTIAPYTATLSLPSNQDLTNSLLVVDGVPLQQSEWSYNSATQIQLTNPPSQSSTYTFTYELLTQCETPVLDLGALYANYVWHADMHAFILPDTDVRSTTVNVGLQFDANGIAILTDRSNGDKSVAVLYEDTGTEIRTVPTQLWDFVDNSTIRMDAASINNNYIYSITYTSLTSIPVDSVSYVLEHRSAAASGTVTAQPWSQVDVNTVVTNVNRYHQLRVSFTGITDVRRLRLRSILLKGLDMFGPSTLPILRP